MSLPAIPGVLDSRQGLNCTLAWTDDNGNQQTYRVRCDYYADSFTLLAEESQARVNRAFYPMKVTPGGFTINVILKGSYEYRHFMDWMATYGQMAVNGQTTTTGSRRTMLVSLAGRDYMRLGIPTSGYEWGDHVGAVVWNVKIVFISAFDPLDPNDLLDDTPTSQFIDAVAATDNSGDTQYFYPASQYSSGGDSEYYLQYLSAAAKLVTPTPNVKPPLTQTEIDQENAAAAAQAGYDPTAPPVTVPNLTGPNLNPSSPGFILNSQTATNVTTWGRPN